jgi:hypothetical protein
MTIYRILDDIEAGASRDRKRDRFRALFLRKGLPSTVCIHGGKEFVMLSPEWMQYVRDINVGDGARYHFTNAKRTDFKHAVGWHNTGKGNRVEQLTFSGNIVDVWLIDGNKAFIKCFYNEQKPLTPIWPDKDHLDTRVQLFTTQFRNKLDMTTDGRYPRTVILANKGELLWIDVANLRKVENV